MGRPARADHPGAWHHVVNRGVERRDIFAADIDRVEFGRLLGVAHDRHGINVHAYCLMTNHYHLLVECPDGGLSDAMHLVGSVYVRHFNERVDRDGPLFRSRYFARHVATDADVLAVARYVHRNPLAFLTPDRLDSYRWSSLRTYLGHRRSPRWMRTDLISSLAGGPAGVRASIEQTDADEGRVTASEATWQHFVDLMVDEHLDDAGGARADRTIMALLLDRVGQDAGSRLRSVLDFPSVNAEQSARSRARRRSRENPAIVRAADAVLEAAAA